MKNKLTILMLSLSTLGLTQGNQDGTESIHKSNTDSYKENTQNELFDSATQKFSKFRLELGAGAIIPSKDEDLMMKTGFGFNLNGILNFSPHFGFSAKVGFNRNPVNVNDEVYFNKYIGLETIYDNILEKNVKSTPGMNMPHFLIGPIFTLPLGPVSFDFNPSGGIAYTSPRNQYNYELIAEEIMSSYTAVDHHEINVTGASSISFLLDLEFSIRTQKSINGFGFKFFTKYMYSDVFHKMKENIKLTENNYGSNTFVLEESNSFKEHTRIKSFVTGVAVTYSF